MSIILDSGFTYALHNEDDVNHDTAVQISKEIESGSFGTIYISDYLFDETMTLIFNRGSVEKAVNVGRFLLGSCDFVAVARHMFDESWDLFQHRKLSFTDCTIIVVMKHFNISYLATFDSGFKGIVKTVGV